MSEKMMLIFLLFSGGVASFAFSPYNHIVLLWAGYTVLFFTIYISKTAKQAFLSGLTFGLGHFSVGTYWLFSILNNYESSNKIMLTIILVGIILFLSLYFAFFALSSFLLRKRYISGDMQNLLIIMPALAVLFDWLKSWFGTGFTWLTPADTLFNFGFSPLLPLVGPLGIDYAFYLICGSLTVIVVRRDLVSILTATVISTMIALGIYVTKDTLYTKPLPTKISTQIIQSNFDIEEKSKRYKVIERIKKFQSLALLEPTPRLSVWPESSISVDYNEVSKYTREGFDKLDLVDTEVLFGAYSKGVNGSYNSIVQASTDNIVYTKQHLMPFGEFTPSWLKFFSQLLPNFAMDDLTKSLSSSYIKIDDINFSPSICYEILFSDELRNRSANANILLDISDLGWFENSWAKPYLFEVARMRAIENQKPMIYVANQGKSAFISYDGTSQTSSATKGVHTLYRTIIPREGVTPYVNYGNIPLFTWVMILGIYITIMTKINKRRKENETLDDR